MKKTYVTKALGIASLLFAFQCSAQGEAATLQEEIAQSLKDAFKFNESTNKCDLDRRLNQKYLYVYEPTGESYTWAFKPEKGGGELQFTFYWGGQGKDRPYNKRRNCRSNIEHGGLVGAFIPY